MMEPESRETIIKRICRTLRRTDGFALYFVQVNLPSARRAIALQVIEQLDRPVIQIDVPIEGFGETTLDGWLLPQLEELEEQEGVSAEAAIFLHGLDKVMPTGQVAMRHFFQLLNWRRSALASVGRPLVIWLPQHALDSMAEHAPDLYDWYSNVYEFVSPQEEAEELRSGFLTEFGTNVQPASRQSKAEKEQWLHTLAILLDEHPKRNAYRARLLGEAGRVHYTLGSLEDALALYRQSLAIYQELGDRKGEGTALNNISQIYHDRGDYDTTLSYLEQSLNICREIGDKKSEGTTLNNISQIYHDRGDYDKALSNLKQALIINRESGGQAGEGTILNNIGRIYREQGDYGKALQYYEQSLDMHRKAGGRAMEGVTLNNIGQLYYARGDYGKALEYQKQSLDIRREIGDRVGEGRTLNNISQVYKIQAQYDTAFKYLEQSLVIRREIGDRVGEAVTSWNIGLTYQEQDDLAKAEQYMARALEVDEEIGRPELEWKRKALEDIRAEIKGR
jgi:tetratricopeptide (TPR) repeat protein